MIRIFYRSKDGRLRTDLELPALKSVLQEPDTLIWMDLSNETVERCEPILRDIFRFHPLAIDDALQETHTPKVDDWRTYLYMVFHAILYDSKRADDDALTTQELDIFMGPNYMVTYHIEPISALERLWEACERDERQLQNGPGYLLYRLVDEIVTDYMPVVDEIDDAIDYIEDQVFANPVPETLAQIFTLKRSLLRLRRMLAPQRESLNKLARGDFAVILSTDRVYFRDVYDHLVRMYDITESLRDLVGSALEIYLSVINNRMNDVMKTLTVITTLFMPASFLVGFFGMNFFQAAEPLSAWTGRPAFLVMIFAMIGLPLGLFLWMRRRAWM